MSRYIDQREPQATPLGFNSELEKVAQTQQDHLSRKAIDGPNQMETTLDMNSERIINLPAPESDHEPLRQADIDLAEGQVQDYVDDGVQQIDTAIDSAESTLDNKIQQATTEANRSETAAVQSGTYRDEALGFRDESEDFKTSARDSAMQLQNILDEGVQLSFPLDLGFITDQEVSTTYDLGSIV